MPGPQTPVVEIPDLRITVDDVATGGDGIAHAPDGRIVFVRGAVPGDVVDVEITEERKRFLRARVRSVVEPGDERIEPACPHVADGCGGCGWQHVSLAGQRRSKVRMVEEALRRIGHLDASVEVGPALAATGHRTTVRCLVVDGRAAFRAERSHDAVPVASCLVAHPRIDELVAGGRFGDATEVVLRVGGATGERLVRFDPSVPDEAVLPADVRAVGADELAAGRRAWFHDEVHGRRFRISAGSFFQSRTDGAAALVDAVRDAGDGCWGRGRLVDLFGGVGLFAACLGSGMEATVVEASRSAAADARHNLGRSARVLRADAARWRPSTADLVIADPPRAGLGREVVSRVVSTGATRVVLVSCDAAAFARDAQLLHTAGYRLRSTTLVDLFPHTPHVELVSRFDRDGDG